MSLAHPAKINYWLLLSAVDAGGISVYTRNLAKALADMERPVAVILYRDIRTPYSIKNNASDFACDVFEVHYDSLDKQNRVAARISDQLPETSNICVVDDGSRWGPALVAQRQDEGANVILVRVLHSDMESIYDSLRHLISAYDLVLCVSRWIANRVRRDYPTVDASVCTPSVSVETQHPLSLPSRPLKLCFLGRLAKEKRPEDIIPICCALKANNIDFKMTIIGDGPLRQSIESAILSNQLVPYVSVLGKLKHENAMKTLKSQHVFLCLSEYEGFSVAAIEAMTNGVIPVMTRVSGADEIIVDGETGFIVDVGNLAAIQEYLCFLYVHPEICDNMRLKAYESSLQYSAQNQCEIFLRAVHSVVWKSRNTMARYGFLRSVAGRRGIDRGWVPNVVVRSLRKCWRKLRDAC